MTLELKLFVPNLGSPVSLLATFILLLIAAYLCSLPLQGDIVFGFAVIIWMANYKAVSNDYAYVPMLEAAENSVKFSGEYSTRFETFSLAFFVFLLGYSQ